LQNTVVCHVTASFEGGIFGHIKHLLFGMTFSVKHRMRKLLVLIQSNTSELTCETALVKALSNHNPNIIDFRSPRKQLLKEKKKSFADAVF